MFFEEKLIGREIFEDRKIGKKRLNSAFSCCFTLSLSDNIGPDCEKILLKFRFEKGNSFRSPVFIAGMSKKVFVKLQSDFFSFSPMLKLGLKIKEKICGIQRGKFNEKADFIMDQIKILKCPQ